jgi:carboxymethylenebutenolidase
MQASKHTYTYAHNHIGGHLAFRAAMNRGVKAAAVYYPTDIHKHTLGKGMKDNTLDRVPELKAGNVEMLMIYGRQDPHIDLVCAHCLLRVY